MAYIYRHCGYIVAICRYSHSLTHSLTHYVVHTPSTHTSRTRTHPIHYPPPSALTVYTAEEKCSGSVSLQIPQGKKCEHLGLKVELVGRIDMFYDRGGAHDFISQVRELEPPSTVYDSKEWKFDFDFDKPFESYRGLNVRVR